MVRAVLFSSIVMWSAGCDQVFQLERPPTPPVSEDDDGDGVMNGEDPCPHIAGESRTDVDQDGISADCDVDDAVPSIGRYVSIRGGDTEDLVRAGDGIYRIDGDGILLGSVQNMTSLILPIDSGTVLVDLGVTTMDNAIEDGEGASYVELGVFSVHRAFTPDHEMRGDNCFVGRDNAMPEPGYLEFNEDNDWIPTRPRFRGPIGGMTGVVRHVRTPNRVTCRWSAEGMEDVAAGFDVDPVLRATTGKVAITTDHLRVRLDYAWFSYQER
ncbi:MAG: hypothetical protein JWP01_1063 [Myxococcales bacterium]|nr:hypothetical protein [Myxococcales bacterium]